MADRIFRSEAGRVRLEGWYRHFLERLPVPVERREVPTSSGTAHGVLAGDESKPTLVCLHGALDGAAVLLTDLAPLMDRFRIVAVDLPGLSVYGPPFRMSIEDDSPAIRLLETIDALKIGRFSLLGVSWGGYVARLTASLAPDRVETLTLIVPAGLVTGSLWKIVSRVAVPMALYRIIESPYRLRGLYEAIATTWDADRAAFMGDAVRDFVIDLRVPAPASSEVLRRLKMPVLLFAASADPYFPGDKLIERVTAHIPHAEIERLAGSKHIPPTTDEFRARLAERIAKFVGDHRG